MYRLSLKVFTFLLTAGSVAQQSAGITNEEYTSASDIWPNKCRPPPSDPQPPNLEDLELDDVLPVGVHHMNVQSRKAQTSLGSLGATFVFGDVGSGKSPVVPLIVGYLHKLNVGYSYTNTSVIYPNDNLFGPTSPTSMLRMLLPEYSLYQSDDFGKVAFWDCPGFNYSRGSKADIAQSYFLKHSLEITKSASFVFTIKYSSVMLEHDVRVLANYATDLLKDVRKYRNSIGLIVTEVNERSVTGEEDVLSTIRTFLKSFIQAEKTIAHEKRESGSGANDTNKISHRINFIEGLLQREGSLNNSRIYFINNNIQEFCRGASNMSVILDLVAKLKVFDAGTLKHRNIVPGEFGLNLRRETLKKIKYGMWANEVKGVATHSIQTAQGIIKELERALLGSRNEYHPNELLIGFRNAFNRHFIGNHGRGHVYELSRDGMLHPMNNEIDFFLSCASQRKKTIQFFFEAMGERSDTVLISTLSQPFQIAASKLADLTDFYTFCNNTYHALAEYSRQRIMVDLKNKTVSLGEDNVLSFLTNELLIEIPAHIKKIWETRLDEQSKSLVVDLVRKNAPEVEISYKTYNYGKTFGFEKCELIATGRIIMASEILKNFEATYPRCVNWEFNLAASEKIFLDEYLALHFLHLVSIVAPVWEVQTVTRDHIEIVLAKDQTYKGSSNGGSFFGVYSTIINSNALRISASGIVDGLCGGTKAGSIYLVSTSRYVTLNTEACGKYPDTIYKPLSGITNYNKKFIEKSLLDCLSVESQVFFEKLASNADFAEVGLTKSPLSLATELETLEQEYYARHQNIHNCPGEMKRRMTIYYERTFKLIKEQIVRANPADKFAFTVIGSLILGRLISHRRLEMSLNVFSTDKYLDAIAEDLESLEKLENQVAIMKESKMFKSALDEKVKASETIVSTMLTPALESSKAALLELNEKLFATLKAFRQEAEKNLEDAKKKLKDSYSFGNLAKYLFGAIEIIGYGLLIAGGSAVPFGLGLVAEGTLLGAAVGKEQEPIPQLSAVIRADGDEVYDQVLSNSTARRSSRADVSTTGASISEDGKIVKHSALLISAIKKSAEIVKDIKSDEKRYGDLKDTISKLDEQINRLEEQKNRVNNTFAPAMNKLSSNVAEETSKLNGTSLSGLSVKKWEMKNMLKTMRQFVQGFTKWMSDAQQKMADAGKNVTGERGLFENFMSTIDNMEDAAGVVYEVYAYIQMYEEKKEFAQFIANVNSPTTGKLADLSVQLQDIIKRFQLSIKINLVIEEYRKAEHAFKQWVFPFLSYYLKTKNDIAFLQSKNLSHVVSTCKENINNFRSALKKYNAITTESDDHLYYYNFTSDSVSTKPFYVWSNEKWQDAIRRLFQGEAIRLKADVEMIGHRNANFFQYKTAIKFKHINIFLRVHDKSLQDDLDRTLKNFRMHMTHSGVSIYKVNGQQFVMRDKAQTYRYNFENHIGVNAIKYKVEGPSGDVPMSPYTWWTLEITDQAEVGFELLQKYVSSVDLVLEGSGTYLDEKEAGVAFLNDLNLSEYYETYEPSEEEVFTFEGTSTGKFHHRCGMGLGFHQHSPRPTPNIFSQAITKRNQQLILKSCKSQPNIEFNHTYYIFGLLEGFKDYLDVMGYSDESAKTLSMHFGFRVSKVNTTTYYVERGAGKIGESEHMTNNITFQSGIEFEALLYDGRKVNNTITVDMDEESALWIIKMSDFEATNKFMFSYDTIHATFKARDAVARLTFKACEDGSP